MRSVFALLLVLAGPAGAGDLWVGVGDSGLRITSADGQTWRNEQRWENREDPFCAVAYGLGRFLAVGGTENTGHAFTSPDGQVWREIPVAARQISAVAFGRERFVALQGAQLLISTDGERFIPGDRLEKKLPVRGTHIACGDTEAGFRFVILGQSEPNPGFPPDHWRAVTTDGTRIDSLTPQPPAYGLAYGAGHFVVVGRNRIESSHDGENWSLQPCPGELVTNVVWTGTRFLATTTDAVWSSPDALTWRRQKVYDPLPILWAREGAAPLGLGLAPNGRLGLSTDFSRWTTLAIEGARVRAIALGQDAPAR